MKVAYIATHPNVSMQKPPQLAADRHVDTQVKDTIFKATKTGMRWSPDSASNIRKTSVAQIHVNPPTTLK